MEIEYLMKKSHLINRKKLLISDGHQSRYVDAPMLADLCSISEKHAYRLITNPRSITPTLEKLIKMQLLGTVTGWPSGWRWQDGQLFSPLGRGCWPDDIENTLLIRDIERDYKTVIDTLKSEIAELKDQLKRPRLAVDNPKPERRVLRAVK